MKTSRFILIAITILVTSTSYGNNKKKPLKNFFNTISTKTKNIFKKKEEKSVSNGVPSASWMYAMKETIGNKQLNQIFIPGTHDSATYKLFLETVKMQHLPTWINFILKSPLILAAYPTIKKWAQCQDKTILEQLQAGARYLDLRVIYRDTKKEFYTAHGLYGPALKDVLNEINAFIKASPKEILIIKIGNLSDLGKNKDEGHKNLIEQLTTTFKDTLISKKDASGPTATLNDIWKLNKNIFLIYDDEEQARNSDILWVRDTTLDSRWPNVDNVQELKKILDRNLKNRTKSEKKFFVTQAQMTSNKDIIIQSLKNPFSKKVYHNLKDMANDVHAHLKQWLATWKQLNTNIINTDFVHESSMRMIFELNLDTSPPDGH